MEEQYGNWDMWKCIEVSKIFINGLKLNRRQNILPLVHLVLPFLFL